MVKKILLILASAVFLGLVASGAYLYLAYKEVSSEAAERIETLGDSGDLEGAQAALQELEAEMTRFAACFAWRAPSLTQPASA